MTQIIVNTSGKLPMEEVWKLALKYCFDKKNLGFGQEKKMRESCFLWNKYIDNFKEEKFKRFGEEVDTRPVGTKGTYIDEIEFYLGIICYHIEAEDNQKTWMVRRKIFYRQHGIDYRKAYDLPNCRTKEDFVRAMKDLKKNMIDRPEDYS